MYRMESLSVNKVNSMNFGKSIKHALIERDLKAKDLADKLGVSPSYISSLSNNKRSPSLNTVLRFSNALNYKLSDFISLGESNV